LKLTNKTALVGAMFICCGCAGRTPLPAGNTTDPVAGRIAFLSAAVAVNRSSLDSVLLQLHRLSGDTSSGAAARSRTIRKRATTLDSAYRASIDDMLVAVNAAAAGVPAAATRYPIESAPTPFLHGFSDGINWILRSPLVHEVDAGTSAVIIVPRGFVSDLASIPEPLQILRGRVSSTKLYANASLVHDYLYWRQDCTRAQADNIMLKAMKDAGVPAIERRLVYQGLRQFGQSAWDGNRRARQDGLIRTVGAPDDQIPPAATWTEYREWLRANRAREGFEYRVPQAVCRMGDTE
jgi:hypothetical protein